MGLFGKLLRVYFSFYGLGSIGDKALSASKAPSFGFTGTELPLATRAGAARSPHKKSEATAVRAMKGMKQHHSPAEVQKGKPS